MYENSYFETIVSLDGVNDTLVSSFLIFSSILSQEIPETM